MRDIRTQIILGCAIALIITKGVGLGYCLKRIDALESRLDRAERSIVKSNVNTAKQIGRVRTELKPQAPCDLMSFVFEPVRQ